MGLRKSKKEKKTERGRERCGKERESKREEVVVCRQQRRRLRWVVALG